MPERSDPEFAHTLAERGNGARSKARWEEVVQILEAALLALVAVATAWTGYQAARWSGAQSELYGKASAIRIRADVLLTSGGQRKLVDISTFNTWIQAKSSGQERLAALYARRFSPEFAVAFRAWLATDPFTNPDAPPGPSFMREYVNEQVVEGTSLMTQAGSVFDEGTRARNQSDDYVRTAIIFAAVLFLLALSQRFNARGVRVGVDVVAAGLMIYGVIGIFAAPRL